MPAALMTAPRSDSVKWAAMLTSKTYFGGSSNYMHSLCDYNCKLILSGILILLNIVGPKLKYTVCIWGGSINPFRNGGYFKYNQIPDVTLSQDFASERSFVLVRCTLALISKAITSVEKNNVEIRLYHVSGRPGLCACSWLSWPERRFRAWVVRNGAGSSVARYFNLELYEFCLLVRSRRTPRV